MTSSAARGRIRVGACLSLSGRFARFGAQALRGLEAWRSLDGGADLVVEDDESDPRVLEGALAQVGRQCDVLLGPYSTQLMRAAGRVAAEAGWLVWNHGGAGDDVQAAYPGHVVSVLTPTGRYAEPFLRLLAGDEERCVLRIMHGKGSFGRQVADGAEAAARHLAIETARATSDAGVWPGAGSSGWDLLSAGVFEDDVEIVRKAKALVHPPRAVCAVAAGVRDFGTACDDAEGVYGIGQWFPGMTQPALVGPAEADFVAAYSAVSGGSTPDYPAVQAVAGAVLATSCARQALGTNRDSLWDAALAADTRTLFGGFKIRGDGVQMKHDMVLVRWSGGQLRGV